MSGETREVVQRACRIREDFTRWTKAAWAADIHADSIDGNKEFTSGGIV
jgi:hypothetical protein